MKGWIINIFLIKIRINKMPLKMNNLTPNSKKGIFSSLLGKVSDHPPFFVLVISILFSIICRKFLDRPSLNFWHLAISLEKTPIRWLFISDWPCWFFAVNIGISYYRVQTFQKFRVLGFRLFGSFEIGAVTAVNCGQLFGWVVGLKTLRMVSQGELLDLHQQGGIATAFWVLFVLFFL